MQNGKVFLLAIILGFAALALAPEANTTSVERAFWNTEVTQYARHRRVKQRRQQLGKIKVYAKSGEIVRSRTGKTAHVNPQARAKFQCLVDRLEGQGYRIEFMGGYRQTRIAGTNIWSKHASGNALDINQTSRNRVTRRLPSNSNAIARSCGLFHGAEWGYADAGHFETKGGLRIAQWPKALPKPQKPTVEALIPVGAIQVAREAMPLPYEPSRPLPTLTTADKYGIFALDEAREYLVRTSSPGATMTKQGVRLAIARLHPQFAVRLSSAIKYARAKGISVGVFSAYRPPAFGIGGFNDKFRSLHAYGLAVDVRGIDGPGSAKSKQWNRIAAMHKIYNPYGASHRAEWNHYSPSWTRSIERNEPLRKMITARGPIDLPKMWQVANRLLDTGSRKIANVGKRKLKYAKTWTKRKLAALKKKWKTRRRHA